MMIDAPPRPLVHEERLLGTDRASRFEGWEEIDRELSDWLVDPSSVVDSDAVPPSREIIRLARNVAEIYKDRGTQSPACVVPDTVGGISFEFQSDAQNFRKLEVRSDGRVRWLVIRGGRVLSRQSVFE